MATTNITNVKAVKKQGAAESVAFKVALRNRFFYVYYRKMSLIVIAAMILCVFSLVSAVYFAKRKTPPAYVPVSSSGQIVPTYALSQPSNSDPEVMNAWVSQWAMEGARKAFNYDYINFTEQINEAQSYFTYRGWQNFARSLTVSQNFNTVQQQKMIVRFTPKSAPIIKANQVVEGRLAWSIQFEAMIQYIAHDGQHQGYVQNVIVKMVLVRMSTVDSPKGLGIDQIVIEEVVLK